MITAEKFKKRLDVINAYWKLMCKYVRCTGTDEECKKLLDDIYEVHAAHGKTAFSRDIAIAVANEMERIMTTNSNEER